MKRLVIYVLVFVITISFNISTMAESVSDLQKQQKENENAKNEAEQQLEETKQQQEEIEQELRQLDETLIAENQELEAINQELVNTNELYEQTQIELQYAIEEEQRQQEIFKKRSKFMYIHGRTGYFEVLLQSEDFSDFINRVEYISRVVEYDQQILKNLHASQQLVETKIEEIEKQKQEIEVLLTQQAEKVASSEASMVAKQDRMAELEADAATQTALIAEIDKSDAEIEKQIQSQTGGWSYSDVPYSGGSLGWPLPGYGRISSGFVSRTNPVTGQSENHKGIDIPAPSGTDTVAAEAGVVKTAGWVNGYGYCTIIDHGEGLSTLYGHSSKLLTSPGQYVEQGEHIAEVGTTGQSTGNHLHFEVRINGKATNPMPYLQ